MSSNGCVLLFIPCFCSSEDVAFSEYFRITIIIVVLSLYNMEESSLYVFPFRMVFFLGQWPKTDVPENSSGRDCCWPYLIGQHPLSPVFGQNRPGTPGNSYFDQLPPVFGHFMSLSGGLLDYSNRSTCATIIFLETIN